MPVPQTWADISTNPASNSPQGSEAIGNQLDDYLRQGYAFSKQLHDGWVAKDGSVAMTGPFNLNGQKIINMPNPSGAQDGATKAYVDAVLLAYLPRGCVMMYWGGSIPAGWILCDGNNGTPDLRDRFPMGAGGSTGLAYGGNSWPVLTAAQMPAHSHTVNDPGHGHGLNDPSHAHGVGDPGHGHSLVNQGSVQAGADNGGAQCPVATGYSSGRGQAGTNPSGTGIQVWGNTTGIGIYGSGTGIWLSNAGGNAAFDNRPAFAAIYFIMKT